MRKLLTKILAVIVAVTATFALVTIPASTVKADTFTFGAKEGASVRFGDSINDTGLRFTIEVDKAFLETLDESVEFGAIITTKAKALELGEGFVIGAADVEDTTSVLGDVDGDDTRKQYYASVTYNFTEEYKAQLEAHLGETLDEEAYNKYKLQAMEKELVCRPYYKIGEDVTYAAVSESRSMVKVANAADLAGTEVLPEGFATKYLSTLKTINTQVTAAGKIILADADKAKLANATFTADGDASDIEVVDFVITEQDFFTNKEFGSSYTITAFVENAIYRINYEYVEKITVTSKAVTYFSTWDNELLYDIEGEIISVKQSYDPIRYTEATLPFVELELGTNFEGIKETIVRGQDQVYEGTTYRIGRTKGYVVKKTCKLTIETIDAVYNLNNVYVCTKAIDEGEDLKVFEVPELEYAGQEGGFIKGTFELINDIDATGITIEHNNYDKTLDPRTAPSNRVFYQGFVGNFDGNGYTISNLNTGKHGLFYYFSWKEYNADNYINSKISSSAYGLGWEQYMADNNLSTKVEAAQHVITAGNAYYQGYGATVYVPTVKNVAFNNVIADGPVLGIFARANDRQQNAFFENLYIKYSADSTYIGGLLQILTSTNMLYNIVIDATELEGYNEANLVDGTAYGNHQGLIYGRMGEFKQYYASQMEYLYSTTSPLINKGVYVIGDIPLNQFRGYYDVDFYAENKAEGIDTSVKVQSVITEARTNGEVAKIVHKGIRQYSTYAEFKADSEYFATTPFYVAGEKVFYNGGTYSEDGPMIIKSFESKYWNTEGGFPIWNNIDITEITVNGAKVNSVDLLKGNAGAVVSASVAGEGIDFTLTSADSNLVKVEADGKTLTPVGVTTTPLEVTITYNYSGKTYTKVIYVSVANEEVTIEDRVFLSTLDNEFTYAFEGDVLYAKQTYDSNTDVTAVGTTTEKALGTDLSGAVITYNSNTNNEEVQKSCTLTIATTAKTYTFTNAYVVTKAITEAEDLKLLEAKSLYQEDGTTRVRFTQETYRTGTWVLANNIDATGITMEHDFGPLTADYQHTTTIYGIYNAYNFALDYAFVGIFDGLGYTISNLNTGAYGLFGSITDTEYLFANMPEGTEETAAKVYTKGANPRKSVVIRNFALVDVITPGPVLAIKAISQSDGGDGLKAKSKLAISDIYVKYAASVTTFNGLIATPYKTEKLNNIVVDTTAVALEAYDDNNFGKYKDGKNIMQSLLFGFFFENNATINHRACYDNPYGVNDYYVVSKLPLADYRYVNESTYYKQTQSFIALASNNATVGDVTYGPDGKNKDVANASYANSDGAGPADLKEGYWVVAGVKQYADNNAFIADAANNATSLAKFNAACWDISSGMPVWRTA